MLLLILLLSGAAGIVVIFKLSLIRTGGQSRFAPNKSGSAFIPPLLLGEGWGEVGF
jgi:hypothetical protein